MSFSRWEVTISTPELGDDVSTIVVERQGSAATFSDAIEAALEAYVEDTPDPLQATLEEVSVATITARRRVQNEAQ